MKWGKATISRLFALRVVSATPSRHPPILSKAGGSSSRIRPVGGRDSTNFRAQVGSP